MLAAKTATAATAPTAATAAVLLQRGQPLLFAKT